MKPRHFSEERALLLRKLLPEYVQNLIPEEEKVWKKAIFENLKNTIEKDDIAATEFWFSNLEGYSLSQTFSFTEDEIFQLLKILYDFCITTEHSRALLSACSLFTYFCNKNLNFSRMTLDWRPLYQVIQKRLFAHPNIPKSSPFPIFAEQFLPFVQKCNLMFSKESTAEMLKIWRPYLHPKSSDFVAAHCLLCIFLPVHTGQHKLWFDDFLKIWPMYAAVHWDHQFFSLYARLSAYDYDDIDWLPHLPFIFSRISRFAHVPCAPFQLVDGAINEYTISKKCHDFFFEVESSDDIFPTFSRLFVNLLSHSRVKNEVKQYFEELAFLLRPMYLPSIDHTMGINSDFLPALIDAFVTRVNDEKKYGKKHLPLLTKEDRIWFVSQILPIVVADRFLEAPSIDKLKEFAELAPEIVVPALLETVQRSFKYEKLEDSALRTLTSIISVIIYHQIDDLRDYLSSIIEQIKVVDIIKTKKIFYLFIAYGQCAQIDDSYSDILINLVRKCVQISESINKEDFHEIKSQMKQAISTSIRNISMRLLKELSQIVLDAAPNFHPSVLRDYVIVFSIKDSNFFTKQALNENTETSYAILQGIVRSVIGFTLKHHERILELVINGIKGDNDKIRRRSLSILKYSLLNMLSILPKGLLSSGYVDLNDISITWHTPSEEDIRVTKIYCDKILELIYELNKMEDIQKKILAVKIASATVRCLTYVISNSNFDIIEPKDPFMKHPPLNRFYAPLLKESWLELRRFLVDYISPDTNQQLLKVVLNTSVALAYPREQIAMFHHEILRERQYVKNTNRVGRHDTYDAHFMHAMDLMAQRQKWRNEPFTEQTAEIIEKVVKCLVHHDKKVKRKVEIFMTDMVFYASHLIPYFEQMIKMIPEYIDDRNALSGIFSNLGATSPLNLSYESFPLFFDTALCVCTQLPNDIPEDQPKMFRKMLLATSDMIDFYENAFSERFLITKRENFIKSVINCITTLTDKEQRFYLLYLSFKASSGRVRILSHELYEIWLNALVNEEQNINELLIACLREFIEILIPRVPKAIKHKYETVTPENFDDFDFADSSGLVRKEGKHDLLQLTRQQYLDEEYVKQYFPDDYKERVLIHELLFSFFIDNFSNVENLCALFVSQQVHEKESFCQARQGFWSSLLRFFGLEFAEKIIELCKSYTDTSLIAQHVVSGELFASILSSLKYSKYADISKLSNSLIPFVSTLFDGLAAEFHKVWYVSVISGIAMRDPRRYYFLFDELCKCFPEDLSQIRDVKLASLLCDILAEYVWHIPSIAKAIEEKFLIPLKNSNLMTYEYVREAFVRAFSVVLSCYFSLDSILPDPRIVDLYDRLFDKEDDLTFITLLSIPYSIQSISVLALNQILLNRISSFAELPMNKTLEQEKQANLSLVQFLFSQLLWACSKRPLIIENVKGTINTIIDQLTPANQPWQTQSILLTLEETFIISNLFFMSNEELDKMLSSALTALNNPNCELQDVAGELLAFLLVSSQYLKSKIPDLLSDFREMIYGNVLQIKISGVKGILSIIQSTLFFETVPDYIFDALSMLNEVSSVDLSLSQLISAAFSEFYSNAQNNMMPHIVELLTPYLNSAKHCYFS
ncbi:hypothetical protein TRFO_07459 [Tritrichomonas foetus]|uniref:Proteasome activator complex subunit 4-like HEAT repeat-like domain-containing protein n=1 Tax=Tritrichomonas foetus TaxID=1144522 RepID=A0A1J4JVL6_9EUKA|nr:hypothetical protein TRFO_07459 [Tritrichomonas foetus]|eukprot:OHT01580.1 hypothetical protein TRFO_07459 [Tritrichomonas foetus]